MRGRYGAFLALPGALRLLVTSLAARLPLGMSSLAMLLLVRQRTGSFADAGLAVGAFTLCGAAATPALGGWLDRTGTRQVLMPLAVGHAAALIALVAVSAGRPGVIVITLIAGVAGALTPPVDASVRVLWPVLAPTADLLEAAYQLDATTQEVIWTLGPLLVAGAIAGGSPSTAMVLTAAIVLIGTGLFVASPVPNVPRHRGTHRGTGALASPGLRVIVAAAALMGIGIGGVEVGLPALAVHVGSPGSAGLLLALWSVGSMAGGILYGTRRWETETRVRYPALLLLVALTTAPLLAAGSLAAAIPLSALAGIGYAPMLSCEYALVGSVAEVGCEAESFAWTTASLVAGLAAGSAIAGVVAQDTSVAACFAIGCTSTALAALMAVTGRSRLRGPARRPGTPVAAVPADARPVPADVHPVRRTPT